MGFLDIILLSIALAMDCFAVSIASGVILLGRPQKAIISTVTRLAVLFGLFQALMPLIGWLATSYFAKYIEAVDHWIAFGMLAFIGIKMIVGAFSENEEAHFKPERLGSQLLLAVATSIDALAVGISFACTGYERLTQLSLPLWAIGIGSFVFSLLGSTIGLKAGKMGAGRMRWLPEVLGGTILILIGVKILFSHLLG